MEFDPKDDSVISWKNNEFYYLVVYPNGKYYHLHKKMISLDHSWNSVLADSWVKIVEIDPEERICWVDYVI